MTDQEKQYLDMVESPIERLILRKAIPSVISLLVTAIYNLVDTFFVGRIGTSATGAVGIVYPLMNLTMAVGLMFGKGTGILMGRYLGRKDRAHAERVAIQGTVYVLSLVAVLSVLGQIFVSQLATLLGTTESMRGYTITYARYILLGMPFYAASETLTYVLQFQGYSRRSMYGMASGAVLNMVLDPILIFGVGLGFRGAALATMLGQMLTFSLLLWQCTRKECIGFSLKNFAVNTGDLKEILGVGSPSLLKNGLSSAAGILLNTAARPYGDAMIASFSIVHRLVHICQLVYFGIGEGFQTTCSYNYGAKKYDRILDGFRFCAKLGAIELLPILAAFLFGDRLIGLFRDDPEVIRWGTVILKVQVIGLLTLPITSSGFVMLQGIGKKRDATIVGCGRQGFFLLPLLLILPRLFGSAGLISVQLVSDILSAILGIAVLKPNMKELASPSDSCVSV